MNRNLWVYDLETLCSCFTYSGYNIDTKEVVQYAIFGDRNDLEMLLNHLSLVKGHIGFNNLAFDYPILHYILQNKEELLQMTSYEVINLIYSKAQDTISDEWSGIQDKFIKIPQLDLFKIWHYNNKARMTSLKKLQIALRYPNVQDMPYAHDQDIFYDEQLQEILDYNLNDVMSTYDFYKKTLEKIALRRGLYVKYGLRCMNFPDTKIGEDLTLKLYCDATGENPKEVRKLRTYRENFKFRECFPDYLNFKTDKFNDLKNYLEGIEVTELKGSFAYSFEYKGFQFDLGTGGIHGCIKSGVYETTDTHVIVDVDVSSLYPSLAIANKLYPEQLGEEFVDVYNEGIVKPRLEAKKAGDMVMANGFKLSANSVN